MLYMDNIDYDKTKCLKSLNRQKKPDLCNPESNIFNYIYFFLQFSQ